MAAVVQPVAVLGIPIMVGCALLGQPLWGLAVFVGAALVEWLGSASDTAYARLTMVAGIHDQFRGLLRTAAALVVISAAHETLGFAALGYFVVACLIHLDWAAQRVLTLWLTRSQPALEYHPASRRQPEALTQHQRCLRRAVGTPGVVVALESLALAAVLVAGPGAGLWLGGWLLGLALASLGHLFWTGWQAREVRRRQPSWSAELKASLETYRPAFIVYVSLAARQSGYILNQWLPAFQAAGRPGLIVAREASQLSPMAATDLRVLYCPTPRQLEEFTLPSIRAAFYLAYGERNVHLLRDPRLRHVMLAHGDSDKTTSANAMVRAFDEIWVAGQAGIDRFAAAGIPLAPEHVALIGRPQVAALRVGPTGNADPVLLYAPTFEGYLDSTAYSSLDLMGPRLIRTILATRPELRVWFRPHPASGVVRSSMLAAIDEITAMLSQTPGDHRVVSTMPLDDCLDGADLLVSDVSSVVSDFLQTERPIITCNPAGLPPSEFVQRHPSQAAAYLLDPELTDLEDVLEAALGDDPLRSTRLAVKAYVLGDPPGGPLAAFEENLARVTTEAPQT